MIPDPSSIDPEKPYVIEGSTLKDIMVVLKGLWQMTNNNPNILQLRTLDVCLNNVSYKIDVICTAPRAGL